jgi:arylformamidase
MSDIMEDQCIEVTGQSESADVVEALRDALSEVLKGVVAAGGGPHHLMTMRWEVSDLARFHPSRHEVELAYREVFAGFRPPVTLAHATRRGLRAVAVARLPSRQASDDPVHGIYSLASLAKQYSPRSQADMNAVFKQWSADGAQFLANHCGLDLAYGPSRYETLDIFMPRGIARPPVWIFVHGGYWQASDKSQHAQFAFGMLDAGFAVVMPNYGLAPEQGLDAIVEQISQVMTFLTQEADNLGIDGSRLHLAGHSAGAHLVAMLATQGAVAGMRSALLLSGLFDLAPISRLPVGKLLNLDPRNVAALSPALLPPPVETRVGLAVGDQESDEFKGQSFGLARCWNLPKPLIAPGNHFSMLEGLKGGALLELAISLTTV